MDTDWNNISYSNGSICEVHNNGSTAKILFIIYYFIILIIGSGGNILALHLTFKRAKKINSTDLYLINLAVSDALFTLALPGRIIYYIMNFSWPFGDFLCRMTAFIFFTNTYVGIYFMTCVSVDRYIAVVHSQQFGRFRTGRKVKYICLLVWFLVLFQTIPLLFKPMTSVKGHHVTCMEYFNFLTIPHLPVLLLLACLIGYCMPVGIIIICYLRINLKLFKTGKENPLADKKAHHKKPFTVIMVVLIAVVLCFSPYHMNIIQFMIRRLLYQPSCSENKVFKTSLQITVALMNMNCCIDPIIYFFAIKGYKKRLLSIFRSYVSAPTLSSAKAQSESNSNSQNHICTASGEK